jgi:hypothetical protein
VSTVTKTTGTGQAVKSEPAPPPGNSAPAHSPQGKPPRVTITVKIPNIVYFPDCLAAWAFGAAPMYRGQQGYRDELDKDHNGIACER